MNFPETEIKPYPDWVFAIIVLLCAVPVVPIPLVALIVGIRYWFRKSPTSNKKTYKNEAFEIELPATYTAKD